MNKKKKAIQEALALERFSTRSSIIRILRRGGVLPEDIPPLDMGADDKMWLLIRFMDVQMAKRLAAAFAERRRRTASASEVAYLARLSALGEGEFHGVSEHCPEEALLDVVDFAFGASLTISFDDESVMDALRLIMEARAC